MAQEDQDSFILYQEDKDSRWAKFLPTGTAPDAKEKKLLHQLECCEEEVCQNQKHRTMEEIIKAIKSSTTNPTTNNNTPKILPHLNPKLTAYRKNLEEKEALKKEDEEDEEDEEEITDEQLFYSTFVLESDDLWGALYEEEKKIEEFFKMRRHTK